MYQRRPLSFVWIRSMQALGFRRSAKGHQAGRQQCSECANRECGLLLHESCPTRYTRCSLRTLPCIFGFPFFALLSNCIVFQRYFMHVI